MPSINDSDPDISDEYRVIMDELSCTEKQFN